MSFQRMAQQFNDFADRHEDCLPPEPAGEEPSA
jgi:hypothetical protein